MTGVWSAALCLFALFASTPAARVVRPNDNTRPAGRLNGAELTLRLVADVGTWRPSGPAGAPVDVAAFGEDGGELSDDERETREDADKRSITRSQLHGLADHSHFLWVFLHPESFHPPGCGNQLGFGKQLS